MNTIIYNIDRRKNMITVDGLTVEFGGTTLFKDISFQINEKDRIALMGKMAQARVPCLKSLPVWERLQEVLFPLRKIAS